MSDKWEICHVERFAGTIEFIHPDREKNRAIVPKHFIKEHGGDNGWLSIGYKEVISILLSQGWEPFGIGVTGANSLQYNFRRKVE